MKNMKDKFLDSTTNTETQQKSNSWISIGPTKDRTSSPNLRNWKF